MKTILIVIVVYCIFIYLVGAFFIYDWKWLDQIRLDVGIRIYLISAFVVLIPIVYGFWEDHEWKKQLSKYKKDPNCRSNI